MSSFNLELDPFSLFTVRIWIQGSVVEHNNKYCWEFRKLAFFLGQV